MKTSPNDSAFIFVLAGGFNLAALTVGCTTGPAVGSVPGAQRPDEVAVIAERGTPRPPFTWTDDEARMLEEIQHGAFNFFWNEADPSSGCVPDRTGVTFASVAGLGFELAALPIGVKHGWVTKEQAEQRARLVLASLRSQSTNRKEGMFFHFLDGKTAAPMSGAYEVTASTIDSAILFAGMIVASSYFGGEVARLADEMVAGANWAFYVPPKTKEECYRGFISLGWRAKDKALPEGDGELLTFFWADAGDEQRLVNFLAAAAPRTEHRVDPSVYYSLRRRMGEYGDGPIAWFPWSGALFTSFFAHCWIDYAHMEADDPASRGVEHRCRVDWWENARRTALMHRRKAIENPAGLPGLGENAWGLSACDGEKEYLVPGLFPRSLAVEGQRPEQDFATWQPKDDWADGTLAPYAAGSAIMFTPRESFAALGHYRGLKDSGGSPLLWSDPSAGGYGFWDSYTPKTGWRAPGCVAIDEGPLLLSIENARSGLVWDLFHRHRFVMDGMARLGLVRR